MKTDVEGGRFTNVLKQDVHSDRAVRGKGVDQLNPFCPDVGPLVELQRPLHSPILIPIGDSIAEHNHADYQTQIERWLLRPLPLWLLGLLILCSGCRLFRFTMRRFALDRLSPWQSPFLVPGTLATRFHGATLLPDPQPAASELWRVVVVAEKFTSRESAKLCLSTMASLSWCLRGGSPVSCEIGL